MRFLGVVAQADEADEWLDVTLGTCRSDISPNVSTKSSPAKSGHQQSLLKPVELLLSPREAQEKVAVDIQLGWQVICSISSFCFSFGISRGKT